MHERKEGTLKSGRSGKKVTSRKQAIAIGLSEARKRGENAVEEKQQKNGHKEKDRLEKEHGHQKENGCPGKLNSTKKYRSCGTFLNTEVSIAQASAFRISAAACSRADRTAGI